MVTGWANSRGSAPHVLLLDHSVTKPDHVLQWHVENDFRGFAVKIRFTAASGPVMRRIATVTDGADRCCNKSCVCCERVFQLPSLLFVVSDINHFGFGYRQYRDSLLNAINRTWIATARICLASLRRLPRCTAQDCDGIIPKSANQRIV
jgi:hypothetical protein